MTATDPLDGLEIDLTDHAARSREERPAATAPASGAAPAPRQRSMLRSVALPSEHGGWGLTGEPIVLGLLLAPSLAGLLVGLAGMIAFVARTPVSLVLVDGFRHRDLERTRLARRVAAIEISALVVLVAGATALAGPGFWWPVAIAAPLVSVQLWFDRRSRSRRLLPELAGAVGITSLVAAITLAGGGDTAVAVGAWAILAARALTSIPFVKSLVMKLHGKSTAQWTLITWDVVAVATVVTAAWLEPTLTAGAGAVVAVVALQRLTTLRPPPRPTVTGIRQTFMGLAVVVATWLGVLMGGA